MIRHVIFDLDGTLVDSVVCCTLIINAMLEQRGSGTTVEPAAVRRHVSVGGAAMMAELLDEHCGDPDAEIREFRRIYSTVMTPPGSVFPGVGAGLAALRASGLTLGICSNKPQNLCEKVLSDVGLTEHFQTIVGGREGIAPKPSPALLQHAIDAMNASTDTSLFVGDSSVDARAAESCGVAFAGVTFGYGEPGWADSLEYRFDGFQDVVDSILSSALFPRRYNTPPIMRRPRERAA